MSEKPKLPRLPATASGLYTRQQMHEYARRAILAEREACAVLVAGWDTTLTPAMAAEIRERPAP